MSSILNDTKQVIGGAMNGDAFDLDLTMAINGYLAYLTQIGVGPKGGFVITDSSDQWEDFVGEDDKVLLSLVQNYIWLKVRMQFDNPGGGISTSLEEKIKEYEWRIYTHTDLEYIPY